MMQTTLAKKLLRFIIPLLTIPMIIMLIFYHNYLIHIIQNNSASLTTNYISQLNNIIEDGTIIKDDNNQYPYITVIDKNLNIIADIQEDKIGEKYINTSINQDLKEYMQKRSTDVFHNEKFRLVIKPILNDNNEIIAFIIGDYKNIFKKKVATINQAFIYVLLVMIFVIFISIILTTIFSYHITNPITQLIDSIKMVAHGDLSYKIDISSNDEIGVLVTSFNNMIEKQKMMDDEIKEQQLLMIHQSRLAQMGETISMIAHQWRQPLNNLSLLIQIFSYKYDNGKVDTDMMDEFNTNSSIQIQNMSKTIDDFRNFFKPHKKKIDYCINDIIVSTLDILNPTFGKYNLFIIFEDVNKLHSNGYPNELGQVLVNIINNAKDALVENNIDNKKIEIKLKQIEDKISLSICDNAGGVNKDIITKIFDPYFSTKNEKNGTGLGLYMSKLIVEDHMNGNISVSNTDIGACFTIVLKENQ